MFNFTALPPLALYIHLPWCVRKCPYCDFNSHEVKAAVPEQQYAEALIADLEQDLPRVWGRSVDTIFFGGGTPSLFSAEVIERLLSEIRARLPIKPTAEITLEANPGTVDIEKFKAFRAIGINRLSIGVQSFDSTFLQRLGRIHDAAAAIRAAEAAHTAGFENFNLDLMYGLPGQNLADACADIKTAIALNPTHISHYQLTIEPNTFFHTQRPTLPDDDTLWAMQEACQQVLAENEFAQYEISAYAKPGKQARHNLNYWMYGDYLGIGAGAHAKITDAAQQKIFRLWKNKHPREYMSSINRLGGENVVTREEVGLEFMMNALRLSDGFPTALFPQRAGLPISIVEKELREAERRKLIEWTFLTIRPTALGKRYLNNLLELFVHA